jgi:hypothetical protein
MFSCLQALLQNQPPKQQQSFPVAKLEVLTIIQETPQSE